MKPLRKLDIPAVLEDNFEHWTEDYMAACSANKVHRGYWGHEDIRRTLREETEGRCAYCESRMADVSYEHVEHLKPKSLFPHLAHSWDNLTNACQVCNTRKGDYFSEAEPLLHPYEDYPPSHIGFLGGLPVALASSASGYRSIKKLGLDRMQLVSSRGQRILSVLELYYAWQAATGETKEIVKEALVEDARDGEYPSAVRACLTALGFPWPASVVEA